MRRQLALLLLLTAGCGSPTDLSSGVIRETLPNGALLLRYPSLPEPGAPPVEPDLTIGGSDEDPKSIFGDVRGIEVDAAGNIYVLDFQAAEIRAFDPSGNYIRSVVTRGRGPGEIEEANGMVLVEDSVVWINEHSKWQKMKMSTTGRVLGTFPIDEHRHGFFWEGTVDQKGVFWERWWEARATPAPRQAEGVSAGSFDVYFVSHDRATDDRDTLYVGPAYGRSYRIRLKDGGMYLSIPFSPQLVGRIDPEGGFWKSETQSYRVVRHDARGDTVVVIDVAAEPVPVTSAELRQFVDANSRTAEMRAAVDDITKLIPETKPMIKTLAIDNRGRVWVERTVPEGEPTRYDVFSRDGEYAGSVALNFTLDRSVLVRIRDNRLYALAVDSTGRPFIVRTARLLR